MGNPLSPVLANIFMTKLEQDVVRPINPSFYDRYVDDCFRKKAKDKADIPFKHLKLKQLPSEHKIHYGRKPRSFPP